MDRCCLLCGAYSLLFDGVWCVLSVVCYFVAVCAMVACCLLYYRVVIMVRCCCSLFVVRCVLCVVG